jgi:hypothetical protein
MDSGGGAARLYERDWRAATAKSPESRVVRSFITFARLSGYRSDYPRQGSIIDMIGASLDRVDPCTPLFLSFSPHRADNFRRFRGNENESRMRAADECARCVTAAWKINNAAQGEREGRNVVAEQACTWDTC